MNYTEKNIKEVIRYITELHNNEIDVAPFDLIKDSQIQLVLNEIECKIKMMNCKIDVLDYGAGNLRLLNAIEQSSFIKSKVEYMATDIVRPVVDNNLFNYTDVSNLHNIHIKSFDIIVLMNVLHELEILEIADSIENIRRLLKDDGVFLLVDMSILPKAENKSLPFYSYELKKLFYKVDDFSYKSKRGIPIVALKILKKDIPVFIEETRILENIISIKRDYYCSMACLINYKKVEEKLVDMSLGFNSIHDFTYLMFISGFANYKIVRFNEIINKIKFELCSTSIEIVKLFFDTYHNEKRIITVNDIFDQVHYKFDYLNITYALNELTAIGSFFFPLKEDHIGESELIASEHLDLLEDYGVNIINDLGFYQALRKCTEYYR